jgi:hypothetical protein
MIQQNRALTITGWVLTILVVAMFTMSATMKFLRPPEMVDQVVNKFGIPEEALLGIAVTEAACIVLFLIPRTAILGAVLLTGYLGGAILTHLRIHDNFIPPILFGVVVWLAVYLRDPRIRELLPLRRPPVRPVTP